MSSLLKKLCFGLYTNTVDYNPQTSVTFQLSYYN